MQKSKSIWIHLYNSLFVVSSTYREIAYLETPIFELFDELDTSISMGLSEQSLSFFRDEGWIDKQTASELGRFRDFLRRMPIETWNSSDFDSSEDWILARKWATDIMTKLKMNKRGWDSTGEVTIFLG